MVYMKTTAIALIAAGSIAPALASYYGDKYISRREVLDELAEILAREYEYDLAARDYQRSGSLSRRGYYDVDEDIFRRAPSMIEDPILESRGFDPEYAELLSRYFSDLEEREPDPNVIQWFKNLFHHKKDNKKAATTAATTTTSSTPTSTPASAPASSPADDGSSAGADADPGAVSSRELYGRDESEYEELAMRHFNDLYSRGFAAEAQSYGLSAREYEDNLDLLQRSPDPNVIQWFKNLFHPKKKTNNKNTATTTTTSSSTQAPTQTPQPSNAPVPTQDGSQTPADDSSSSNADPDAVSSRELYGREELEYEDLLMRYYDDIYRRELAASVGYYGIAARGFEDDASFEVFQRSPDPNVIQWFKNLFHPKKKDDTKAQSDDSSSNVSSREFDNFYDLD